MGECGCKSGSTVDSDRQLQYNHHSWEHSAVSEHCKQLPDTAEPGLQVGEILIDKKNQIWWETEVFKTRLLNTLIYVLRSSSEQEAGLDDLPMPFLPQFSRDFCKITFPFVSSSLSKLSQEGTIY